MEVLPMLPPGTSVMVSPMGSSLAVISSPAAVSLAQPPLPLSPYSTTVGSLSRSGPPAFATSLSPVLPVTSLPLSGYIVASPYGGASNLPTPSLSPRTVVSETPTKVLFSSSASLQRSATDRTSLPHPTVVSHTITVPTSMPVGTVATYHLAQAAFERQEKGIELDTVSDHSDMEVASSEGLSGNGWNYPEGDQDPEQRVSPYANSLATVHPVISHPVHAPHRLSVNRSHPAYAPPLSVNDPHLLFGGIPTSYGRLDPPPLPVLFPPQPEPESEPEMEPEPPTLPEEEWEPVLESVLEDIPLPPLRQQYKMPTGREQPYFYANHAPLSPPGYRPENSDPPAFYAAHQGSFTGATAFQSTELRQTGGFQCTTQQHIHVQHAWHSRQGSDSHQPIPLRVSSILQQGAAAPTAPSGPVSPRTHMAMVAFEKFDTDHSGNLDVREFHKAIVSLGLGYSFDDAENLFNMMDEDGNGIMSMQEFLAHCREYINNSAQAAAEETPKDPEAQARQAFHRFDRDRDGFLDVKDFLLAIRELGLGTTMEDAEQLFSMVDEDGSGTMDEDEFVTHCISAFQNGGVFGGSSSRESAPAAPAGPVQYSGNPTADAANLFRRFDEDQNGYLDIYEFMRAMKELGLGLTFQDAKSLFSQIDTDGSGMMDEEEFTTHYINHIVKQRRG
eukprot:GGOE01020345.1.p1 GENE.GGOE01020345.1~~GGOE01020345.1.p1  ORF type:complete len:672 (-),score=121.83 GGOE01020345.1:252-2267(-)